MSKKQKYQNPIGFHDTCGDKENACAPDHRIHCAKTHTATSNLLAPRGGFQNRALAVEKVGAHLGPSSSTAVLQQKVVATPFWCRTAVELMKPKLAPTFFPARARF